MTKKVILAAALTAAGTALTACGGSNGTPVGGPAPRQAYTLCWNTTMTANKEGLNSGWIVDDRGGPPRTAVSSSYTSLTDVSDTDGVAYIREFNEVTGGTILLETKVSATGEGAYAAFCDPDGNSVWRAEYRSGAWRVAGTEGEGVASPAAAFRVTVDLDRGVSETFINGVPCGTAPLGGASVLSLRIGVDEAGRGTVTPGRVSVQANYAVCETFDLFGPDAVYGWETEGTVTAESSELLLRRGAARKRFAPVYGRFCVEAYVLLPAGENAQLILCDGDDAALTLDFSGELTCGGQKLRGLERRVWQRLRIEADADTGEAEVFLNGRAAGAVRYTGAKLDALSFRTEGAATRLDNLYVYNLPGYEDYVPEPAASATADDGLVGINVCSLWVNGTHWGWSCVTPYDEPEPVLGYYDEGTPESADWEIRFMVEHGIDFQAFCWYADVSNGPLKRPFAGGAIRNQLHDGFMYAKYSDRMKYTIIWEAANGAKFNSAQFRNSVVPYWFENYFCDDRYLKIDNMPVLCVFGGAQLPDKYFGSADATRAELDWLRAAAREHGFDGVILLNCGSASDSLARLGFDGAYAYNWGTEGSSPDVNRKRILESAKCTTMVTVPTVSVGFDSIPWHGARHPNMTVKDFGDTLEWVKKTFLPSRKAPHWAENLLMLSTWNEYGEGTYIMPSGLNGFGYLDQVRRHCSALPEEHGDVVPTDAQKERINHLYPQYARLLRRSGWYDRKTAYPAGVGDLFVNGRKVENVIRPVVRSGATLYPFDEGLAIGYRLGAFVTWRKLVGTLKLEANGHTVVFTVGSDAYEADGAARKLSAPVEKIDGIPMLDFSALADAMGWQYEVRDGNAYVTTHQSAMYEEMAARTEGQWDFNGYDTEGWTSPHMSLTVANGALTATSASDTTDPILTLADTLAMPAGKYTDVELRCRFRYSAGSVQSASIYFLTDADTTWDEAKSVKLPLGAFDSGEEWKTIRVSLKNVAAWEDTVTKLRFDPFNGVGTMEIDCLRFIPVPDYVYVPPEERPFAIKNGDAERPSKAFFSDNATITIEQDPDDPANRIWMVKGKSGKNWTYFRQSVTWREKASYTVEFDARLVSDCEGETAVSTQLACNLRYADADVLNGKDHVIGQRTLRPSDGWVHVSFTHTVGTVDAGTGMEFTIYANPVGDRSVSFMVDNVVVTEKRN